MTQEDALNQWYQPQKPPQAEPHAETKEYTRQEQLFDAVLWEAEYGDDERKPFFFALCERLLEALKHD